MTVGLCLSNGKEAFVLADLAMSVGSDVGLIGKKISVNLGKKSSAILCGCGDGNLTQLLVEEDFDYTFGTLEEFRKTIHDYIDDYILNEVSNTLEGEKGLSISLETGKITKTHDDAKGKKNQIQISNDRIEKICSYTGLVVGAENNKLKVYKIKRGSSERVNLLDLNRTGAGLTKARNYNYLFMPGIDLEKCNNTDLALQVMSAYCFSESITSVGGTPELYSLDKEGSVYNYNLTQRCAMFNVAAARLTGQINMPQANWMFDSLLHDKDYNEIARSLDLTPTTLTTTTIPYLSWQERVNHKRQNNLND